jgi:drug/metabolite transporter (DMT)-like permease
MDAVGKTLSAIYSPLFLVWARYLVLFLVIFLIKRHKVIQLMLGSKFRLSHLLRAAMLLMTSVFGLYALKYLPLAETAGLAFTSPLFAILLARLLLGEDVGLLRWLCMLGGFFGALIIVYPGSELSVHGIVFAIFSSITFAFYQIMTRRLAIKEHEIVLLMYPAALGAFAPLIFLPFIEGDLTPNVIDAGLIVLLGILSGAGHYFSNKALALTSVSKLAPLMYLQLVWAMFFGWILFGQLPSLLGFCGIILTTVFGAISVLNYNKSRFVK